MTFTTELFCPQQTVFWHFNQSQCLIAIFLLLNFNPKKIVDVFFNAKQTCNCGEALGTGAL
jgi:hypothetical protein